jgi:uncharacterized protein (DUF2384 family)
MKLDTWANVHKAMLSYYQDANEVLRWSLAPNPALSGRSPLDVWVSGATGREEVRTLVKNMLNVVKN